MNKRRVNRVGLTMRIDSTAGYGEVRDALSRDWHEFMAYALPEVKWVPVPNIGAGVGDFIKDWEMGGFILTGGNDVGAFPERDATEKSILSIAVRDTLPVFGVCRGLQIIQTYFGGGITRCPKDEHVAREHKVEFSQEAIDRYGVEKEPAVNSYHNYGVRVDALSEELQPFAVTEDGWVEALSAKERQISAVLWHPERGRPFRQYDRRIMRAFFGL